MKIDKADKRLLLSLDCNSRATFATHGKNSGLSQEAARYRIQRLMGEGVIKYQLAIVDTAKLGFAYYKVLFKLHSVSEANIEMMVRFFRKQPSIAWIVRLEGGFDLGIVVCVTRIHQLSLLIDECNAQFYKWISNTTFSVNVRGSFFPRTYLVGKNREKIEPRRYSAAGEPYKVDDTDREILFILAENSQTSAADIARSLSVNPLAKSLTPEAVSLRIKRLEQAKVLTGYNVILDNSKLNQIYYKVLFSLNHVGKKRTQKFVDFCQRCGNFFYFIKSFGPWDYEGDFEVNSVAEQREIMMRLMKENPGVIRDFQPLLVTDILKYNCFPR